ncbi:MAG: acyltransferase [Bacteroidaceae bacterium]|nr:acyltransferase [Bacteroidaceae bacterium]
MPKHEDWKGNTDGTPWMHRVLIRLLRSVNLRWAYAVMGVCVVPPYLLFSRKGYRAIYRYFRRRHLMGRWEAFRHTCLNHYRFGQVILDRFAAYGGRQFHFEIDGNETFQHLLGSEGGFIVLSCHVGNYELAGYTFRSSGKRYNALVFPKEAAVVMKNRQRLLSGNNIRMIPVRDDMEYVFQVSNALADGEVVSVPCDRLFGSPRFVECDVLGGRARLPLGPFAMAIQRGVPAVSVFVMKETVYSYKVFVRPLELQYDASVLRPREKAAVLAQCFADELGRILGQYKEQWFNYYDFWNDEK